MSLYFRLGAGLALGATLLAAAGCFNTDVTAFDDEEPSRFDKSALDMYLTDVAPPMVEGSVNTPEAYEGFYGEWEAKLDMKAASRPASVRPSRPTGRNSRSVNGRMAS